MLPSSGLTLKSSQPCELQISDKDQCRHSSNYVSVCPFDSLYEHAICLPNASKSRTNERNATREPPFQGRMPFILRCNGTDRHGGGQENGKMRWLADSRACTG